MEKKEEEKEGNKENEGKPPFCGHHALSSTTNNRKVHFEGNSRVITMTLSLDGQESSFVDTFVLF